MAYRLSIDSDLLDLFLLLDEDEQAHILQCFAKLKALPFTSGRYSFVDAAGRDVEATIVSTYLIYHWSDHAVKTVNVIGMERV